MVRRVDVLPAPFRPPAVVRVDRGRLTQVLVNLLSNAIKFNDNAAPVVEIDVRRVGRKVEVAVSDNGPGIQTEDRDLIFTRFSRSTSDMTSKVSGSGLGLAISAEIVQILGGRISLRDKASPGAVFVVELPLAAKVREEATAAALSG